MFRIYIKFKIYKIPGIKYVKNVIFYIFPNLAINQGFNKNDQTRSYLLKNEPSHRKLDINGIKSFSNMFSGEECLIIGNGPSINNIDFKKFKNIPSFAVNSFYLKSEEVNYFPTFFTIEDKHVFADNINKIKEYKVNHKFLPNIYRNKFYDDGRPEFLYYKINFDFYNGKEIKFSKHAYKEMFAGGTVTYINFQLAYLMGFKRVYLIGLDFNYVKPKGTIIDGNTWISTGDDPNHFDKSYFGEGKRYHDPQLHRAKIAYQKANEVFKSENKEIVNLTENTKLDVFKTEDIDKYF